MRQQLENAGKFLASLFISKITLAIGSILVVGFGSVLGLVYVPPTAGEMEAWKFDVRQSFELIEKDSNYSITACEGGFRSPSLTDSRLFSSVSGLRKAVLTYRSGQVEEFYFTDGDLIFVYGRGRDDPAAKSAYEQTGNRYYFRRGGRLRFFLNKSHMFQWISPEQRTVSSDSREFSAAEQRLLRTAHQLAGLSTSLINDATYVCSRIGGTSFERSSGSMSIVPPGSPASDAIAP
jgi:hypothetical protein